MARIIYHLSDLFERHAFGVCTWLGDKLQMKSSEIRLFFIYASFLTLGSPLIVYLHMAFILKLKDYIKSSRTRVWDL
jgi:phage shock protein PspC (stress-responsive transcriptional regulator)